MPQSTEAKMAYNKAYWEDHKEEFRQKNAARYQNNKEQYLETQARWRNNPEQRARAREVSQTWRAANPERHRTTVKTYYDTHHEKLLAYHRTKPRAGGKTARRRDSRRREATLRRAQGHHSPQELAQLTVLQGGLCAYCAQERLLTVDHMIPISRGGSDGVENLKMACGFCNSSKGAKTLEEWCLRLKERAARQKSDNSNIISTVKLGGLTIRHMHKENIKPYEQRQIDRHR